MGWNLWVVFVVSFLNGGLPSFVLSAPSRSLLIFVIDESGSMESQKAEVIGGYNDFLKTQKKKTDDKPRYIEIRFSTVVTPKSTEPRDLLQHAQPLTLSNYRPKGSTALYDAIGEGVRLGQQHRGYGEKVIFVIFSDGEENYSRKFTKAQIKGLIGEKQGTEMWEFLCYGVGNCGDLIGPGGIPRRNYQDWNHANPRKTFARASNDVYRSRGAGEGVSN